MQLRWYTNKYNFSKKNFINLLFVVVIAVENGQEALDELLKEDSNFDLVLLDDNMPEMVNSRSLF